MTRQADIRPSRPDDMAWIVGIHARVFGQEYGWGPGIEALTARICADFSATHDPATERCWLAECDGERLGSVFLIREVGAVARLRLLMLAPAARGTGLGRRLVDTALAFAREAGYREVVLLTHQVLTAARSLYDDLGFQLEDSWSHDDFGRTEIAETWRLRL